MNAVGEFGILLQMNTVAPPVSEYLLAGGREFAGAIAPFDVAPDVFQLYVELLEFFRDLLEAREAAEGVLGVAEISVDIGAGLFDLVVLAEDRARARCGRWRRGGVGRGAAGWSSIRGA